LNVCTALSVLYRVVQNVNRYAGCLIFIRYGTHGKLCSTGKQMQ